MKSKLLSIATVSLLALNMACSGPAADAPKQAPTQSGSSVMGDHVTFTENKGALYEEQPGEYIWSYDGSALILKLVKDDCGPRRVEWPFSKWMKQS